jgi:DNA polymerase III alpha subunit
MTARVGSVSVPSVQSVIAGLHEDGEIVTVTGIANCPVMEMTARGDDWGTFKLVDGNTSVRLHVFPKVFAEAGDQLNPVREPDRSLRPSTVQVTARVDHRDDQPALIAQTIVRLSDGEPVAVPLLSAEQFGQLREAGLNPDDGISLDEAVAMLREGGDAR